MAVASKSNERGSMWVESQSLFRFSRLCRALRREKSPYTKARDTKMAKQVKSGGARKLPPLPKDFYDYVALVQSGAALKSWTKPAQAGKTGRRAA